MSLEPEAGLPGVGPSRHLGGPWPMSSNPNRAFSVDVLFGIDGVDAIRIDGEGYFECREIEPGVLAIRSSEPFEGSPVPEWPIPVITDANRVPWTIEELEPLIEALQGHLDEIRRAMA